MKYQEAVEEVAKERGCTPGELPSCPEELVYECTEDPCPEIARKMAQPSPDAPFSRFIPEGVLRAHPLTAISSSVPVIRPGATAAEAFAVLQRPVLPLDAKSRNDYPLWDGLFAYFGSALCEVARLSKIANDQHNPGEPLHWARNKSLDHKNKILKHILDAELMDTDETLHATKLAWRSLALLQTILEKRGAPVPPNAY